MTTCWFAGSAVRRTFPLFVVGALPGRPAATYASFCSLSGSSPLAARARRPAASFVIASSEAFFCASVGGLFALLVGVAFAPVLAPALGFTTGFTICFARGTKIRAKVAFAEAGLFFL